MADLLTNSQGFRFKDIDLYQVTEGWSDDLPSRLATYEYLKRDGAEVEVNGAGQKKFTFTCVYIGPGCTASYTALAASVQRNPKGPLTHPRLGHFQVACAGIKAQERPGQALDCIEFTIEFVEDQVDQTLNATIKSPQTYVNYVQDALLKVAGATSSITDNRLANAVYSALVASQAQFVNLATQFIDFVLQFAQSTPDNLATSPTIVDTAPIESLLAKVAQARDDVLAKLTATLVKTLEPDVSLTDARTACYIAYASCVRLHNAAIAQRPPIIIYTVRTAQPLTTVAVALYGNDARARIGELYQLNRIPTPYWIPAGTEIRALAPSNG